jgi:hypothetical protein
MSGYIYGLICASVAIGLAELLIPESAKTRPYLRLLLGLALILVLVKPLGRLADMIPELEGSGAESFEAEEYSELAVDRLREIYREAISKGLAEELGLCDFQVGVLVGEDKRPSRVTVTLMGKDIFRSPYAIEEYVASAFGCECITVIG